MQPRFIQIVLSAWKWSAVIAEVDDKCIFLMPRVPQLAKQYPHAAVEPTDRFIVLSQVLAHTGQIGQMIGNQYFRRRVGLTLDLGPFARITEVRCVTMRITVADSQEERPARALLANPLTRQVSHSCHIANPGTLGGQPSVIG